MSRSAASNNFCKLLFILNRGFKNFIDKGENNTVGNSLENYEMKYLENTFGFRILSLIFSVTKQSLGVFVYHLVFDSNVVRLIFCHASVSCN